MTLINGNYLDYLRVAKRCREKTRCMFADIRDNIGLAYDGVSDRTSPEKYRAELEELVHGALSCADIFWLSHSSSYEALVYDVLKPYMGTWEFRKVIWYFTFGQYNAYDFTSCYRPIVCLKLPGTDKLNFDAVRIASTRMEIDDKRAAGPKVPTDVWEFPRIVGNTKERRPWHPTQHPEALMERIILLSCTETTAGRTRPIGTFTDLCMGSGTSAIVCKRLIIPFMGIELSPNYCAKIAEAVSEPYIKFAEYMKT